jgi:hypothetical protein
MKHLCEPEILFEGFCPPHELMMGGIMNVKFFIKQ